MLAPRSLAVALVVALAGCKSMSGDAARVADAGFVTTPARNQGATAFCWAYAVIAHVEQRYFELTRGATAGGFRLDLSEEYLGLVHMTELVAAGQTVVESKPMSEALALIERYGLVPEPIFKAKFDRQLYDKVRAAAVSYRQDTGLAAGEPLPVATAATIVGEAAALTPEQVDFLARTMSDTPATFSHSGGTYSPRTFATNRLKFVAADYFVMKMPSPLEDASAYATLTSVMRKALLYGYSLPVSFNYVTGSENQAGVVRCKSTGCPDATLAKPGPTSPHANHAALLIDYRTAASTFGPLKEDELVASLAAPVTEWVIKNSWGLARSNSYDPQLLERFPFPSFTVLTDDFLRASHRLASGRYEVIVPRRVCLKRRPANELACSDLISDAGDSGVPVETNVTVATADVVATQRKALSSQDAVVYDPDAPTNGDFIKLKHRAPPVTVSPQTQVDVAPQVTVSGASGSQFTVCMQVEVQPGVRYVPVYLGRPAPILTNPMFVLTADSNWRHCTPVGNTPRTMNWVFQAVDRHFKARQQIAAQFVIQ